MARQRRIGALLVVVAIISVSTGCAAAGSPTGSASTSSVSGLPSSAPGAASAASLPSAAGSISPVDMAGFADATCDANAEFGLAWGNPDANIKSAAWTSFEKAIEQRDTALLDSSAADILGHIAAARSALARGATWRPGAAANAELDAVLVSLQTQVTTVRDARADPAVAKTAAATMDKIWPQWLSYAQRVMAVGADYPGSLRNVPCESSSPAP